MAGHGHEGHNHEAHDHGACGHDHDGHGHAAHNHDGHDHEAHGHDGHSHEGHGLAAAGHPDEIVFDKARQERFGVRIAEVEPGSFASIVHVGGQVLPAQGDVFAVISPASGSVSLTAGLTPGSHVSAGAAIALVSSSSISGGNQVEQSRAAYEAAKSQYERDRQLAEDKIVSAGQLERSRLDYIRAKSEYEALHNNGKDVELKASEEGYVLSLEVVPGQYVEAGQTIAMVSKDKTLMLRAEIPERYAATVRGIDDANFSTPSGDVLGIKAMGGRLASRSVNAADGYFTLCFEFPAGGAVVPGAFAEVWLKSRPREGVVCVPKEALVEDQGVYGVFVQLDEDCFRKQEVRLGDDDGRMVEVVQGLKAGDRVVTGGSMHIKLASVSAVPSGHNHSH